MYTKELDAETHPQLNNENHSVASVNTMHHDFSPSGLQPHSKMQAFQPQDTYRKPHVASVPTPFVTASQSRLLGQTATLDSPAPCFQPAQNVGPHAYQPSMRDLVTALTLPQPEVQMFSGDPIDRWVDECCLTTHQHNLGHSVS